MKQKPDIQLDLISRSWGTYAPDTKFSGMTLAEYNAEVSPSVAIRASIQTERDQRRGEGTAGGNQEPPPRSRPFESGSKPMAKREKHLGSKPRPLGRRKQGLRRRDHDLNRRYK